MNLSKKRKITAFVTVAIMVVAVVTTACVLAAPTSSNDYIPDNIAPLTDVADDTTLKINPANYSSDTASLVYIDAYNNNKKDVGYIRVLYPNTIYLDKTESLQDAKYYIAYDARAKSNGHDGDQMDIYDNLFGVFAGSSKPSNTSDAINLMNNVFDGYGVKTRECIAVNGDSNNTSSSVSAQTVSADSGKKTNNSVTRIEARDVNTSVIVTLKGTIKESYKSTGSKGTFTHPDDTFTLVCTRYKNFSWWSKIRTQDFFGNWDSSPAVTGSGSFYGGVSATEGITVPNFNDDNMYKFRPEVGIYIYDKSELLKEITRVKPYMDLADQNKDFLNKIGGDGYYDKVTAVYKDAYNKYTTREVTQDEINTATDNLKAITTPYVFELSDLPSINETVEYSADNYKDTLLSNDMPRFDFEAFDLKINDVAVTSESGIDMTNVGSYNVKVSLKSTIKGMSFKWASDTNKVNGYQDVGTITITPAKLKFENIIETFSKPFKNSAYTINPDSINADPTTLGNVNFNGSGSKSAGCSNAHFTNLYAGNTATVKFSEDKTDWKDALQYTDVMNAKTVYYKAYVTDTNNYDPTDVGELTVTITKATLTLTFTGGITQTYGEAKLDSDAIRTASTLTIACTATAEGAENWASGLIAQIFTFRVAATGTTYNGAEYLDVNDYNIRATVNTDWQDRVNTTINYNNADDIYTVNAKTVALTWSNTQSYYNNDSGHRSVASVAASQLAEVDQANSVVITPTVSLVGGGTAIHQGTYQVTVDLNNGNYTYSDSDLAAGAFTIKPRPITVTLSDRDRTYAQNGNAKDAWQNYLNNFADAYGDVNGVFSVVTTTTINDGSDALVDAAASVFTVTVGVTANDFTGDSNSADPLYNDADRYFRANTTGYALSVTGSNDDYVVTSGGSAKLVVKPATIDYTNPNLTNKVYNSQEQTIKIADSAVKAELSGYENAKFETLLNNSDPTKAVTVKYKVTAPTAYVMADYVADLKLKDVANYTISYQITAPNHTTKTGTLTTQITKCNVYIDVTPITRTYGDAILSSDELKTQLPIKFYKDANKSEVNTFASELSFKILGGDGSDGDDVITTTREAQVGTYTIDCVDNTVANNYKIAYINKSNEGTYIVEAKDLNLTWTQSGAGWDTNGTTLTYNGARLAFIPQIDASEVVTGDTVTLTSEPTWKKDGVTVARDNVRNVGKYEATSAALSGADASNYNIANPTQVFNIIAREVTVKIMNMSAEFGHANAVPIGTPLPAALSKNPNSGALWDYYDGDEAKHFVGEDYEFFRLHSIARHPQAGESYVGAGDYLVEMQPINPDSQAAKNYTITLNKDGVEGVSGWNAVFTINKTNVNYTGRQFNIDFDNEDEDNYVTKSQIVNRINLPLDKDNNPISDMSEFTIEITDLLNDDDEDNQQTVAYENLEFKDVIGIENLLSSTRTQTKEISSQLACGRYFIYIRITHSKTYADGVKSNYETFTGRIEVNIQSGWFSIVLNGTIKADYGERTDDSITIYNKLAGLDESQTVDRIADVIVSAGDGSSENMDTDVAKNLLKQYVMDGTIEFYVGVGNTITDLEYNKPFGNYTIFIRVKKSAEHQYFRFLDAEGKAGEGRTPTNIGAYEVTKKLVKMAWGDVTEVYGTHADDSAFHQYRIDNITEGDDVRVIVKFYKKNDDDSLTPVSSHSEMHDVGNYLARVEDVTDTDNYWIPTQETDGYWIQTELTVVKKEITIELKSRNDLTYGSANAKPGTVEAYLNDNMVKGTHFVITVGDAFGYDDELSDLLTVKLGAYTPLGTGLEYMHAGDYAITYLDLENPNYDLTVIDENVKLTIKKATIAGYSQYSDSTSTYTGSDISLIKDNIQDRVTLVGDKAAKLHAYQNIQVTVLAIRVYDEESGTYVACDTVKNAGKYHFDIKIVAPDHEERTFSDRVYEVEQAEVKISMKANTKAKTYGETLADMLAGETGMTTFNEWLKKYCDIKLTYTGTIAGIDNDFEFIVIDKNTDLEGVVTPLDPDVRRDAGKYDVFLNTDKLNGNYDYEFVNDCNVDAYVISARNANVTWRSGSANTADTVTSGNYKPQYTASSIALSAWVTDIDDQEYQLNVTGRNTNVGTGTATVSVDKEATANKWMKNYNFVGTSFNYEIVKRNATVTIKNDTVTFGATNAKLDSWKNVPGEIKSSEEDTNYNITITGATQLAQFIKISVDTTSNKEYLDAKTYTIKGTCSSNNYNVTWNNGTLTVNKATVTNSEEKTISQAYNGKPFTADIRQFLISKNYYKFVGGMTWDNSTVTVTYSKEDATVTGIGSKEVEFTITLANHNDITGKVTVEVSQAEIVLAVEGNATSVYGSPLLSSNDLFKNVKVATSTWTDVTLDDIKKVVELKVNTSLNNPKADTYSLAIVWKNNDDKTLYDIQFNNTNTKGVYEVTPKEITFTWDYTATTKFVYNGSTYSVNAVLNTKDIVGSDVVGVNTGTGMSGKNAGTYTATAGSLYGADADNYKLSASSTLTWKIEPKEINVDWKERSFTYDGQSKNLAGMAEARKSELVGTDTCDIEITAADADKVYAGKHTATAVAKNNNYKVNAATAKHEFEIKQAIVTITWDEDTLTLTYNGAPQAPKASIESGLVTNVLTNKDDECKVVVIGAEKDVKVDGKYTATATLDNPNYMVATSDATTEFSIAPKAITFTWDESTLTLTYTGEAQAPKAEAVGAVEGDVVEFEYEGMQVNATPQGQKYTAKVKAVKGNNYILDTDNIAEADMSTDFVINKGVNGFVEEGFTLPATVSKLPWTDGQNPDVKWGTATVKYYSDEALTQEVDINNASEGKYWVVVHVAETDNYFEFTQVFEVEVEGGLEILIIAIGAVVSVLLIVGAAIVVVSTNKKKKLQGGAQ